MKMVKSLILGSAAGLIAMSGAQAADLPVKAKAVEYVKVCSLYGAGFFYIPGTDTCIKLGGYLRVDTSFNASGAYDSPNWAGAAGQAQRARNNYIARAREDLNIDTRTATEYGVVRTFFDATFNWTTGTDSIAGGSLGVYYAFIQFAGFTMGKAVSQFSTPWTGYPGNNTSFLIGGEDDVTGINQLAYTASFGNGVTGTISLEDPSAYRQGGLYNVSAGPSNAFSTTGAVAPLNAAVVTSADQTAQGWFQGVPGNNGYGGVAAPDIVGQLRVDQAWGLFQASVAAHNLHASYYGASSASTLESAGHPSDTWGWAGMLALSIKNIPTGPGDTINMDATYANGASRYVIGGVSPNNFSMFGGTSNPLAFQSVALGISGDGVFAGSNGLLPTATSIQKSTAYGFRGAYTHNWDAYWNTSLFGSYSHLGWGATGGALICQGLASQAITFSGTCNPDFSISQIGAVTRWTPVKNLTFSAEVMYVYLRQNSTGLASPTQLSPSNSLTGAPFPPGAAFEFKSQSTVVGGVRAQRTF
jgi:hypothetical protein